MASTQQLQASRKRHTTLNDFFFADRFDSPGKSEFRRIYNAFKAEVKFRLGKSFQWERDIYDPDLGSSEEFEGEFELAGRLADGIHTPVMVKIAADCPVVRPLSMSLQLEDSDTEEISGFYDFGNPLQHFLDTLEHVKKLHSRSEKIAPIQ